MAKAPTVSSLFAESSRGHMVVTQSCSGRLVRTKRPAGASLTCDLPRARPRFDKLEDLLALAPEFGDFGVSLGGYNLKRCQGATTLKLDFLPGANVIALQLQPECLHRCPTDCEPKRAPPDGGA